MREITGETATMAPEDVGKMSVIADLWLRRASEKGWRPHFEKAHRHDGLTEWHCYYCYIMEGEQHRPWRALVQTGRVQSGA